MEWVKAFHVISIIAWMAGLLYLPRLFVNHVACATGSEQSEIFKGMEKRLYRFIMTPAMLSSWFFGLWMILGFGVLDFSQPWVWAKGVFVIALTGMHGAFGADLRRFANDKNTKSARYFRMVNEVPTLLMVGIVILVIVRPFS